MSNDIPEEEIQKPRKLPKILAIIAIILIITYFTLSPFGFNVIVSLLKSYTMQDNVINFKEKKIIFQPETYNELKQIYYDNQKNEFKLCLKGKKLANIYFINEIFRPREISSSFNRVVSESCPKDTLIDLHKHPYRHCIFSQQDIKSYNINKKTNKDLLMALMCEKARFNFYDANI